jgi:hypothetical protein
VIHRALAKRPVERFSTVGSFARALKLALDGAEPSFSNVAVPARGAADDFPTPTESFVGMLDEPASHPRRPWLPLVLTIAFGGIVGAILALVLISDGPQDPPEHQQPVVADIRIEPKPRTQPTSVQTQAPVAPPTQAPVSQPVTEAKRVQPQSRGPVKPRPPKPIQPKTNAPRTTAPKPTPVKPDPRVPGERSKVLAALKACQCRQARATLNTLRGLRGGSAVARSLAGRVKRCIAPDVDEICVNGKVKPQ